MVNLLLWFLFSLHVRDITFLFISLLSYWKWTHIAHTFSLPHAYILFWILQTQQPPMSRSPGLAWFVTVPQDQSPWTSLVSGRICSVQGGLAISLGKQSLSRLPAKGNVRNVNPRHTSLVPIHKSLLSEYTVFTVLNEKSNLCLYLIEERAVISIWYIYLYHNYFRILSLCSNRGITIHLTSLMMQILRSKLYASEK